MRGVAFSCSLHKFCIHPQSSCPQKFLPRNRLNESHVRVQEEYPETHVDYYSGRDD